MREGSIEDFKGMSVTPRKKKTTTSVDSGITNNITETSIEVTADNGIGVKGNGGENGRKDIGRKGRGNVKTMNTKGTNLKGKGICIGGRELINREGAGRRDKTRDTTRTTIPGTRNRSTVQVELRPVGG